ncbi:hypothetical protein [Butyricicoccus sp. OF10-2]|uniref:hypothetical protein n=1 Tax=Butyricicoccus sp. OF10-2 TaxID=2292298 RepID=UPI000E5CDE5D|nr:hypothetical protein [Butyricicoccus sp. OF10-2]RHV83535.1 hypothetical protein DXB00_06755 [Butyricicoccus sp. OF10-2]
MLGVNQSDFMSYMSALKSNYRKGVHRMEAILSNPTHAKEFAANLGGVSVVLGVPVNLPDRNSDKLLELLLGSDVADDAVETWLHQFYEFTGWDDLLSDSARCKEMANNPLIWRAAGGSKLAVGKSIATLAGLSCADYADIDAVAASQVAMAAVIGNATALNAVVTSSVAMAAIVKSPVAMAAMWRSDTAIKALQANATAWKTFTGASSAVMGKTVAILANLDPSGYADMTAVASSQVAMTAVASSQVAMAAVAASQVAMAAIIANATALNAVVTSSVAMAAIIGNSTALNAVVTSQVAMAAIAGSGKARVAITNSSGALAALASSSLKKSVSTSACNGNYAKLVTNGPCFIISATHNNSGWTFGVRYVYTSETASGAKTYSSTGSAQSINLFTTSAG